MLCLFKESRRRRINERGQEDEQLPRMAEHVSLIQRRSRDYSRFDFREPSRCSSSVIFDILLHVARPSRPFFCARGIVAYSKLFTKYTQTCLFKHSWITANILREKMNENDVIMDYLASGGFALWTAIIWGFFNVTIFGLTLCCKCCDRPKIFVEYCNVLKISALSIDKALNLYSYFFLLSHFKLKVLSQ